MPGIFVGSNDISAIYVGATPVQEVYVGAVKVWPTGPPGKIDSIQFVDTGYQILSPRTTAAVNFGPAAADRRILLAIGSDSSSTSGGVTSVTIGGVAATLLASQNSTIRRTYFYMALVPTGTNGTVVINNTGHNMSIQYGVWALTQGVPTMIDQGSSPSSYTVSGLTQSIDDFVIAVAINGSLTGTPTLASNPAGLNRNANCSNPAGSIRQVSGRHRTPTASSGGTVTVGWPGSVEPCSMTAMVLRFA